MPLINKKNLFPGVRIGVLALLFLGLYAVLFGCCCCFVLFFAVLRGGERGTG